MRDDRAIRFGGLCNNIMWRNGTAGLKEWRRAEGGGEGQVQDGARTLVSLSRRGSVEERGERMAGRERQRRE